MAKMTILGLTGGIGMGKSTVATLLGGYGFPVYCADEAVHDLMKKGGAAVAAIGRAFPDVIKRGAVDRGLLGRAVFNQPDRLGQLESIIHPRLHKIERAFLQQARKAKARAVVLDIPLLFETGAEVRCDYTLCVSAPRAVQKARVLARPGMTPEKLRGILSRQMSDAEKRRRADAVVPTGGSLETTARALDKLLLQWGLVEPETPVKKTAKRSSK